MIRVLKKTALTFALVISGIVALALAIFIWPSILINARTLPFLVKLAKSKGGVVLEWKEPYIKIQSASFWEKSLKFSADEFCISFLETDFRGCTKQIRLNTVVDVRKIGAISRLSASPKILEAEVKDALILTGDTQIQGEVIAQINDSLHAKVLAKGSLDGKAPFSVSLESQHRNEGGFTWKGKALYSEGKRSVEVALTGEGDLNDLKTRIKGTGKNLLPLVSVLSVDNCDVSRKIEGTEEKLKLSCPAVASLLLPDAVDKARAGFLRKLEFKIDSDIQRTPEDPSKPIKGKVNLSMEPLVPPIKEGKGSISLNLMGLFADFPNQWKYDIDGNFEIAHFQKIVSFLNNTPVSIPAPFNDLTGAVTLKVGGKGEIASITSGDFPFTLKTLLVSETQNMEIDTVGSFSLPRSTPQVPPLLRADVALTNVKLVLPKLNYSAPPKIAPDSRIKSPRNQKRTVASSKPSLALDISIHTLPGKPAHIVSNLAEAEIPIELNLKLTHDKPLHGNVKVSRFPLELFRRKAHIESFKVVLAEKTDDAKVDGKIKVVYTDYTITIWVTGQLNNPKTVLLSDPPLPEKQVIAVLLFGRTMEELDSDQLSTAANTRAALTNSAITLASMYALASTPVESVGYDAVTGVFSAKLRIADGTSVNIGTDMSEVRQLGVRKRLGPHWGLHTYVEDPFTAAARSLTTFLEWTWRY